MSYISGSLDILKFIINDGRILFTIAIGFSIYYLTKRDSRIQSYMKNIPGPSCVPLLGASLWFLRPNHALCELILSWYRQHGSVFCAWLGNHPLVMIGGATEVEAILASTVHIEKSREYDLLHKWLGLGLLTAKPNKWHSRRKLLTPTFHFKILEEFTPIFNEQANIFVNILKEKTGNKPFDIFPLVTRCALDIICETAMGKKLNAQSGKDLEYVKAVYGYGEMLVQRFLRPWYQLGIVWKLSGNSALEQKYIKILHGFTEEVINKKKLERKQLADSPKQTQNMDDEFSQKKRKAFLDLLLEMAESPESPLTDKEIREETDTFMFEGHDTTAANMVWTILTLSSHPEYQKRVQEELDGIFGDDKKRDITSADIAQMKFLSFCIMETLRIYPSVPFFFRHLNEDAKLGDKIIPRGCSVVIAAHLLHRDPKVFPDPETFNPERFFPENCIGRSPFAFVPFSAGNRNCIGQKFALLEEKIVLAKLFMNFIFEAVDRREEIRMVPDIILRPLDGIRVKISQR